MVYLGIDYGTKRIGLAVATDETPAVPYGTFTISDLRFTIYDFIGTIVNEHIDVVVVGNPKAMGLGAVPQMQKEVEQFVEHLKSEIVNRKLSVTVEMQDERLTSRAADALKKEFGSSGQRDSVAAMLILETYLSRSSKSSKASESS